jgi:hypothetical protein
VRNFGYTYFVTVLVRHQLSLNKLVRMNKSRMLDCIVLQCGYHYLSMFLTIYQPPDFVRILGIVVAEAVIIVLIVRKDASYTDQNNDIYDHRA